MSIMKKCFRCSIDKPLSEFYKHKGMSDGYLNKCKECAILDEKNRRVLKADEIRKYEKSRANLPHRVSARKEYQKTNAYLESHKKSLKKYRENYPERDSARTKVNNAVRDGRLIPWPKCFVYKCDCSKLEAHHPDYSRPLDVVWLCDKHHKEVHRMAREK